MPITEAERERRLRLLEHHYAVENAGDIPGIMATFAPNAVMLYNGVPFPTAEAIEGGHLYLGFQEVGGAFDDFSNHIDKISYTDTEIIVEGRATGTHAEDFLGFVATHQPKELPFIAMYYFNDDDLLESERVIMNLGPLNPDYIGAPPA